MKQALYKKIISLLQPEPTDKLSVLDIGCGNGEFLDTLSQVIDSKSSFIGIDESKNILNNAKVNSTNLFFQNEKFVDTLNFEDNYFDLIVSIDTLECIPNKTALLSEINRVLKPNGKVVVAHWDWDTQVYNSHNKKCIRKFVNEFSDWQQDWMETSDGQMGRKLWALFEGSNKYKGEIACFTLLETEYKQDNYGFSRMQDLSCLVEKGTIEKSDYDTLCREMEQLHHTKEYFYSVNSYIYIGTPNNN